MKNRVYMRRVKKNRRGHSNHNIIDNNLKQKKVTCAFDGQSWTWLWFIYFYFWSWYEFSLARHPHLSVRRFRQRTWHFLVVLLWICSEIGRLFLWGHWWQVWCAFILTGIQDLPDWRDQKSQRPKPQKSVTELRRCTSRSWVPLLA